MANENLNPRIIQTNNKNNLRVIFKKNGEEDTDMIRRTSDESSAQTSSFMDILQNILRGYQRYQAAFQNRCDQLTWGFFSKAGGVLLLKICILGIIMFAIWHDEIVFTNDSVNFASASTEEKTRNKHAQRTDYTPSETIGSGISFDLSPAAAKDLREQDVKNYIERFSKVAVAEMDAFGIPASISMAQAIIESRCGTSVLAVRNRNHFGVKCFSKSCPAGHCSNYTDDHHKDFFRKYGGDWESWREHSQFLMKYRYRDLKKHGKNYKAWAVGLRDFGYATDNQYDKKLISVIERYELYKLDDL